MDIIVWCHLVLNRTQISRTVWGGPNIWWMFRTDSNMTRYQAPFGVDRMSYGPFAQNQICPGITDRLDGTNHPKITKTIFFTLTPLLCTSDLLGVPPPSVPCFPSSPALRLTSHRFGWWEKNLSLGNSHHLKHLAVPGALWSPCELERGSSLIFTSLSGVWSFPECCHSKTSFESWFPWRGGGFTSTPFPWSFWRWLLPYRCAIKCVLKSCVAPETSLSGGSLKQLPLNRPLPFNWERIARQPQQVFFRGSTHSAECSHFIYVSFF